MHIGARLARELRRRCNTKQPVRHQLAWYSACNELEKFADEMIAVEQLKVVEDEAQKATGVDPEAFCRCGQGFTVTCPVHGPSEKGSK
jgi:hypothetical protein